MAINAYYSVEMRRDEAMNNIDVFQTAAEVHHQLPPSQLDINLSQSTPFNPILLTSQTIQYNYLRLFLF